MPADRREERQAALARRLDGAGLDALVIAHLMNIRYLTGFTGSAALLLFHPGTPVLFTDFRYAVQAPREVGPAADVVVDPVSVWDRLRAALASRERWRVGFEAHVLTAREATRLRDGGRLELVPVAEVVEPLRAVKAAEEVAAIRAAVAVAEAALAETLPAIRPGAKERDIAGELERALRRGGSEWHPFPTIVASGPRSALPHARTSDRAVEAGDLVLVDFGAQVDGYCADLTRTFVAGAAADDQQRLMYGLVREAQERAIAQVRPGMTGAEADASARDVIARRGFGERFGHSLGHGVGLEVHEAPRLAPTAEERLPAHAVVTIEPGIYLEGWGGVRVEDDVYLAPTGPERLSDAGASLLELR